MSKQYSSNDSSIVDNDGWQIAGKKNRKSPKHSGSSNNSPVTSSPRSRSTSTSPNVEYDSSYFEETKVNSSTSNHFKGKSQTSSGFFKSKYTNRPAYNNNNNNNRSRPKVPFYQCRDKEFIALIENNTLNSENINAYLDEIHNHDDLKTLSKNEYNAAIYDTLDKLLYSSIRRIYLRKNCILKYAELIKSIIDRLAEKKTEIEQTRKILGLNKIKNYNEASALMWLDDDVDFGIISMLLRYLFNKLYIHPFKPNSEGENLFNSLIVKFKTGNMSNEIFTQRYNLLLKTINSPQRSLIIQGVLNMLTDSLANNSAAMIKFKMLFLVNPEVFIRETLQHFIKTSNVAKVSATKYQGAVQYFRGKDDSNNSNNKGDMIRYADPMEIIYIPRFIEILENLFEDNCENESYCNIVNDLGLLPLFKNAVVPDRKLFFAMINDTIIKFCDPEDSSCILSGRIVNASPEIKEEEEEEDDESKQQTVNKTKNQLLAMAYLSSQLDKLNLCPGLINNVVGYYSNNSNIDDNSCLELCISALKFKPFEKEFYIKLLADRNSISSSNLHFVADIFEYQTIPVYAFGKPTIELLVECLQGSKTLQTETEQKIPVVKSNQIMSKSNQIASKSKKKRRTRAERSKASDNGFTDNSNKKITSSNTVPLPQIPLPSPVRISYSAPSTPANIITPLRDSKSIEFFSVSRFDDKVLVRDYEDILKDALYTLEGQLKSKSSSTVFKEVFDEVLDKSRNPSIVQKHVVGMIREIVRTIIDGGDTSKEDIQRLVEEAAEIVEEKKDELACVSVNYETIKKDITSYLNSK